MVTKSSNVYYNTTDPIVSSTEGALEEAGRAEQHITEAAPNELKLGEGAQSDRVSHRQRGSVGGVRQASFAKTTS